MYAWTILPYLLAASPWAPSEWKIHLNFGRETDTPHDVEGGSEAAEWGASGARLALTVPVCITAERSSTTSEAFLGNRCDQLQVLNAASFISLKGEQHVNFAHAGAWRLNTRQTRSSGDANAVRIMLELQDAIQRNDIVVQPQRLYLVANAWRENELEAGQQRMKFIQQSYEQAQEMVDISLSHESGDRRLDGTNLLDTAAASIDMANLVKRRDDRLFELRQAQMTLPHKDLSNPGKWPGSDEGLVIQQGVIAIKHRGGFFGSDELAVVGRWTTTPIESVEDHDGYEDYDEEEEEEDYYYKDGDDDDDAMEDEGKIHESIYGDALLKYNDGSEGNA